MESAEAKKNRLRSKEAGLKIYSGRPCVRCNSTEKYVSNNACKSCTQRRTNTRPIEVQRKYIKSDKGREFLKKRRRSDKYREAQKRWSLLSGFHRQQQHRRRAVIRNCLSRLTEEEFARLMSVYKEAGRLTRDTGVLHHVDHIIPLIDGGLHHPDNLQVLAESDHFAKTANENIKRYQNI